MVQYSTGVVMKTQLPLAEYSRRQIEEMLSPFHRWVTGEKVGHNPTKNELAEYYVRSGAARDFSEKYEPIEGVVYGIGCTY